VIQKLNLGNCNIKRVKETKTLGVIIDDQLKSNAHNNNNNNNNSNNNNNNNNGLIRHFHITWLFIQLLRLYNIYIQ
jgi:hypothetical protein